MNALKTAVPDDFTLTFFDNTPKKLDDVGSFGTRLTHSNPKINNYLKTLIKEEKVIETGFCMYAREKDGKYSTPRYNPGFDTIGFVHSFFEQMTSDWHYITTSLDKKLGEADLKNWK